MISSVPPPIGPYSQRQATQRTARLPQHAVPFRAATPTPPAKKDDDYSIWRDTALRYGGYADEVGEFLTPYLGGLGKFVGYGLSTLYCLGDMGTTLPQKFAKGTENGLPTGKKLLKTGEEGLDLAAFHGVATLWIPPMLIGSVVDSANKLLDSSAHIEKPGDPIRRGIMGVADKIVDPIKGSTTQFVNKNWVDTLKPFVANHLKAPADRMIRTHNRHLARMVNPFAAMSAWVAATPGLSKFWGPDDAKSLQQNVDNLAQKVAFQVDDLTRLLFVKPLPVMIGVGMVPLIAHPFDKLMLKVQDWTIRPLLGKNKLIRQPDGSLKSVRNPGFWGKKTPPNSLQLAHVPNSQYWMVMNDQKKLPPLLNQHHHFMNAQFGPRSGQHLAPTPAFKPAPGLMNSNTLKVRKEASPAAQLADGQAFIT